MPKSSAHGGNHGGRRYFHTRQPSNLHLSSRPKPAFIKNPVALITSGVLILVFGVLGVLGYSLYKNVMDVRQELYATIDKAGPLPGYVLGGETAQASSLIYEISDDLSSIREKTQDPLWQAAKLIPALGNNLVAVEELVAYGDDFLKGADPQIQALLPLAQPSQLMQSGAINLEALEAITEQLVEIRPWLKQGSTVVEGINTVGLIDQVSERLPQITDLLETGTSVITQLEDAIPVLLPMLGSEGPRDYIVMVMNNSEVRAGGGLQSDGLWLRLDEGRIELYDVFETGQIKHMLGSPILQLAPEELAPFPTDYRYWIGDYSMTPDFPTTAQLMQELILKGRGDHLPAVIGIDPVFLSMIMAAGSPITLTDGTILTSENTVAALLSDVYARYSNPTQQDLFFIDAAETIFENIVGGKLDFFKLAEQLLLARDTGHFKMWSENEAEQEFIQKYELSGELQEDNTETTQFGVFHNDFTWAKLSYYLRSTVNVQETCNADGSRDYAVELGLTSVAPEDGDRTLSSSVLAHAWDLIDRYPKHWIRTDVMLYTPVGGEILTYPQGYENGKRDRAGNIEGRDIRTVSTLLAPGETATLNYEVHLPAEYVGGELSVKHTPMAFPAEITTNSAGNCG